MAQTDPDPNRLIPWSPSKKFIAIAGILAISLGALLILGSVIENAIHIPDASKNKQVAALPTQRNVDRGEVINKGKDADSLLDSMRKKEANDDAARKLRGDEGGSGPVNPSTGPLNQNQDYASGQAQGQPQSAVDQQRQQLEAERLKRERESFFADNIGWQNPRTTQPNSQPAAQPTPAAGQAQPQSQSTPQQEVSSPAAAVANRKAIDFDPSLKTFILPQGTYFESALTNRLDGDGVGPVKCMITRDVYLPMTQSVVIPKGAFLLGEASKVSSLNEQRLAVAFHRLLVPKAICNTATDVSCFYSVPLDQKLPALNSNGSVGLTGKVNNHYFQIFGASLAIGAIGGLAQLGNGANGFAYDSGTQFRNGVSQSMAMSSEHILDRFLNRLPTIGIPEGKRVDVMLTDDLTVPVYGGKTL